MDEVADYYMPVKPIHKSFSLATLESDRVQDSHEEQEF